MTVVPWKQGKILVWDATCSDTLAPFHSSLAIRESGAIAADAEYHKRQKYAHLENTNFFVPVGVETLGVLRGGGGSSISFQGHWSAPF